MITVSKRLPRTPKSRRRRGKSAVKNVFSSHPGPYRCKSVGSLADRRVWQGGVRHLKRNDPILAKIIGRVGPVKFELDDDHYEVVVGSIIFQQLAGSAAQAILNRFKQLYGGRLPSPREYLSTDVENLRSEEHTSELQSRLHLVCRLLLEKKKKNIRQKTHDINCQD